jgi:hypothetical protein
MKPYPENSESSPLPYHSTVMFEDRTTGHYYYGTMYSSSGDGIYCRSDVALRPGASINIKIENMHYNTAPKKYFGEVRWCNKMNGNYELGIKIIKAIYD